MDNPETLENFLGKVLASGNNGELGNEVLGILRQWKTELEIGEQEIKVEEDSKTENIEIKDNTTS